MSDNPWQEEITIGFVGNPNCGKTTLFNAYTGANLKVANWPGVTVEKKEGAMRLHDHIYHLVDLPGTYSLTDTPGFDPDATILSASSQRGDETAQALQIAQGTVKSRLARAREKIAAELKRRGVGQTGGERHAV